MKTLAVSLAHWFAIATSRSVPPASYFAPPARAIAARS
jgi:hypothetical protein